ncbi:putative phage tail protein [Neisseria animaloris]|uniref:phage tail protein n=1 Tax=Neisseria animaloris TaxID=326522 RepID=UPI000A18EED7|nr:phage tail protein [Neisseria animaloris]OSI06788.1 host specificity protein J [Neisseria animaloris]VEH86568.1 putative phage tail protein [Neisseria animaloris]
MGGKSGGGARTPYEAPNTLSSAQTLRIIDAVCEGVVYGFANGNDAPLKSVFFNDTPVQNADGSYNFHGVTAYFLRGEQDQAYVPGFDGSERTVAVSSPVKKDTPVVRGVSDGLVTRIRVTVGVERNVSVQDNGDTLPASTRLTVELVGNGGKKEQRTIEFTEKSSGAYYHDVVFDTLPPVPFNIRVSRVTPDSNSDKLANKTFFASYVEIVDAKLCYPHTAVAALKIDSDQFGNQVPRRNYLLKGKMVKVPANYNPETRQYSGQTWDGSFKTAWTNNPAWVFYDLLTQPRYSTLARRLKVSDIDKWSLYQVARYCDQMVPDGFGGQEPRFVCNAYVTNARQAGELLTDLASVFMGLPVWNGNQVSVVLDSNSDPVAQYSNSNVVDGLFSYSGAGLKSVHTAVHVQYLDKYDGYRAKTEYIADDEAIKRYGLNIKQVTAFGCDSRGQAARYGAWTLQTELRQQNTVSFTVGREGLRHLPYDIIQVMDNDYAGAELSGRVSAVAGNTVTLDREVQATAGMTLYIASENGVVSAKVAAAPAKNQVRLDKPLAADAGVVWVLSGKVKPRLYRAIGIKENTDDGTYTITALLHDPQKYGVVDGWANFDRQRHTLHNVQPELINPNLQTENGAVVITWDNLTADGTVLTYDIKLYKDGKIYRHIPDAATPEIKLEGLPNGDYRAEIRGRNARGVLSQPLTKAWSLNYAITGLKTTPKMMAVQIDWTLPQTVVNDVVTELWYGTSNNRNQAKKLVSLPYPQNSYTVQGVAVSDRLWFWARIVDKAGVSGEFAAPVLGRSDPNPDPIVKQIAGSITESTLSRDLIASWEGKTDAARKLAEANAVADAARRVAAEAAERSREISRASQAAAQQLTAKAAEIGTRIGAVENVNSTQAQQISTVTAAHGQTAAGLEAERRARADGDRAEAAARNALAARVGNAESGITRLQQTVAEKDRGTATQLNSITASLNNLGGVNLLVDSEYTKMGAWNSSSQLSSSVFRGRRLIRLSPKSDGVAQIGVVQLAEKGLSRLVAGVRYTLSFNVQGTAGFSSTGLNYVYLMREKSEGGNYRLETIPITASLSNRVKVTFTAPWSSNTVRLLIGAYGTFAANDWFAFHSVKLERGSVATDWSATPDDLDVAVLAVDAALSNYKTAQAKKEIAWAQEINTAKAQIGKAAAEVTQMRETVATLDGKVRATYALKVETIAGGRKVAAGLQIGVDGQTADSQVLFYADKFGLVDPRSKQLKTPFVVVNDGGRAKVALDGDMIATGMIQGKHIAAGLTLQSPIIRAGRLEMGTFNMAADGSFTSAPKGNAGLTMTNKHIFFKDSKGRVVVVLGDVRGT